MSRTDFLPTADAELSQWAVAFARQLATDPGSVGLSPADADECLARADAYRAALIAARDPQWRTLPQIVAKDDARARLERAVRAAARRARAFPGATASRLAELGLRPPPGGVRLGRVPRPTTRPVLSLSRVEIGSHTIRIGDESSPTAAARPRGVAGAEVFAYVGDGPPPADLRDWQYLGRATRPEFRVTYRPAEHHRRAHLAARWTNAKGQPGPLSAIAITHVAA